MVDRHPVRIRESAGAIPAVLTTSGSAGPGNPTEGEAADGYAPVGVIATEQTESRAAANRSTGFDSPVASNRSVGPRKRASGLSASRKGAWIPQPTVGDGLCLENRCPSRGWGFDPLGIRHGE